MKYLSSRHLSCEPYADISITLLYYSLPIEEFITLCDIIIRKVSAYFAEKLFSNACMAVNHALIAMWQFSQQGNLFCIQEIEWCWQIYLYALCLIPEKTCMQERNLCN